MPENPIHPGRNSTNTSDVPPETNLAQSALKSCLIYTRFSLALKPSVPALCPLPSPTGRGAAAEFPPQPRLAGLVLPVPWQSAEGGAWRLSPTHSPSSSVLQKMWHQPSYDNNLSCPERKFVSSFGQEFSDITPPSRKPSLFGITRWWLLHPSI